MLTTDTLQEFVKKYQTQERNVVREYIQHLFLAALYKIDGSEKLLFKGGTALRLIYQSPRFSEDLDFTGVGIFAARSIEPLFLETLAELERMGLKVSTQEAKKTTGGYLGVIRYEAFGFSENMKFEISLRQGRPGQKIKGEVIQIVSDFAAPYTVVHFPLRDLVSEKVQALLARRKPRDYYDLYFMLRHPEMNRVVPKENFAGILQGLKTENINFKRELSVLLPVSHHLILKDFKKGLEREMEKYVTI